jgi:hypothetical protein
MRSLRWTIYRKLDKILRLRRIFRAGIVLLPLAGFIHVSLINDVFGPDELVSDSSTSDSGDVNRDDFAGSDAGMLEPDRLPPGPNVNRLAVAPTNTRPVVSVTRLASTWSTADPGLSRPVSAGADGMKVEDVADVAAADGANDALLESDMAAIGRSFGRTTTYVVNEGGSLWRTGKRFIDDDVLLDKLIDNLAESGMDVRSVRAGLEFIVKDFGTEGRIVIVDDDGDTYESHIIGDSVTTSSVRHQDWTGIESTRTAWLEW